MPDDAIMYIYNEDGNMITGPITATENNQKKVWGSSIYKGEGVIVEIKTTNKSKNFVDIHINSLAHGYKNIFREKAFGDSGPCNINILCPLGSGWDDEANSIALILNATGDDHCSGSMVMNSCNTDIPNLLTADHCYTHPLAGSIDNWRFIFQYWSPTCTPNQDGVQTMLFNGAWLNSHWPNTDFALLRLKQFPPLNSGIAYAGWSRSSTAPNSTTCIHHPRGDVMKITQDSDAPVKDGWQGGAGTTHWLVDWDNGVVEPGSSGSPLFDPNHRVIGQLHGGNSGCSSNDLTDWYGAFDVSWLGGGTSVTRLSDWLDKTATGATTTNTTLISNLTTVNPDKYPVSGASQFCTSTSNYSISNIPTGATVTWSALPKGVVVLSPTTGTSTTATVTGGGFFQLTATITGICGGPIWINKSVVAGPPPITILGPYDSVENTIVDIACLSDTYYFIASDTETGQTYTWTLFPPPGAPNLPTLHSGSTIYLSFNEIGTYTLQVSKTNSCGITTSTMYIDVEDCTEDLRVMAAPNPAKDLLLITIESTNEQRFMNKKVVFELIDITGKKHKAWTFSKSERKQYLLNLNGVHEGLYILRTTIGNQNRSIKILIE